MTDTLLSDPPRRPPDLTPGLWLAPGRLLEAPLTAEDFGRLSQLAPTRHYRRGQAIYRAGEATEGLFMVRSGHVKVASPQEGRVLAVVGPDELFGTFACGHPQPAEALALDDAQVMFVSCHAFEAAVARLPRLGVLVAVALAAQVRALQDQLDRAGQSAPLRLARTLLDLTRRFGRAAGPDTEAGLGADWRELALELRQDEIASLAGTSRVSATAALSQWRALGLVQGTRGRYRVRLGGLETLVDLLDQERHG